MLTPWGVSGVLVARAHKAPALLLPPRMWCLVLPSLHWWGDNAKPSFTFTLALPRHSVTKATFPHVPCVLLFVAFQGQKVGLVLSGILGCDAGWLLGWPPRAAGLGRLEVALGTVPYMQ